MGKASYTDRKLTDAERSVSQKYYYLVSYFIWKKHLIPMTEWEGELAIPYIQAIKKYSDYDQLHCFSIKTVIFYALDSARANYFKKRNCAKRKAAGGEVYYDEKEKQGAYISDYRISGNPMITEQVALSNAMVEIILENMEIERQKLIVKMLIWGYKKIEIRNQLDITNYRLQKELKNIRNIINQIYFDKENIN